MQMNELLRLLQGVSGGGNQYKAKCPVHEDSNPSLSIGQTDDKILLRCHRGCSTESIIAKLGLEMKHLYIEERVSPSHTEGKPKRGIAAVYDYEDLDGNIVHSTVRFYPKDFRQRRPDPEKPCKYIWNMKGIMTILYNLPAVTQTIKEKQPVLVVEGEKDCNTLGKYGFTATTCPMGAGKWRSHYSTMLKGGRIYIIADNDEIGNTHAEFVAESLLGVAESVYLIDLKAVMPELPEGGDITDFIEPKPQEGRQIAIDALVASAKPYYVDEKQASQKKAEGSDRKKSQAEQLLEIVELTGAEYFHSDIKELYAAIPVHNHFEVLPIIGRDFEIWLNSLFYKGSGKPISKDAIKQVIGTLSAKALFDNPNPVKLSVRVAAHDGAFWYDMTNSDWQAVKITQGGWEVVDNPLLLFVRYRHQKSQVMPQKGGNIRKILDYVNIKESKTLFLCWLVSCFIPSIPHAILIIHGEKGATKSTASGMTKSLIDPSALETLTLSNDQRTLLVNFQQHWYLPFDNVSYIGEETSDTMCRVVTGGNVQQRKLHTNAEDTIFMLLRCIAINGIHNVATKSDLLDRSILIELMRIKDNNRKELSEIMADFEADKAEILGGIFDTLVKTMAIYPAVKLKNLPRMADFARWGYAIGEALGGMGQQFLDEYTGNYRIQNEEAIASDPTATLIVEFMRNKDSWYGRYSDLFIKLKDMAEDFGISTGRRSFPQGAIVLSKKITAIKSNLENIGIDCVRDDKVSRDGQRLSINRAKSSSPSTPSTQPAPHAGSKCEDDCEDKFITTSSTQLSTHQEACNLGACVDGEDGVDKNGYLGEWLTVDESIGDDDLPIEFLNPSNGEGACRE